MRRVHVDGTRHVCEAALRSGRPRIVVASTSGTIAVSREPVIHDESSGYATTVVRLWPYYLSKIEQERLVLDLHERDGLDAVLLNPSILYGPGDVYRSSTDDVRHFIDGRIPNVPSGGLNFVDVRDAARAFVRALTRGETGERYLIGGANLTVSEFFGLLEQVSGVRAPRLRLPEAIARAGAALMRAGAKIVGSRYPIDDISITMAYRYWYCDSRRAEDELDHRPRAAEITLQDTIAYIRGESGE
jgi:dihydroflavonol-4-reductase